MVEFESRELVAVLGSGNQPVRIKHLLEDMEFDVADFQSIDEFLDNDKRPYAVIIVADAVDTTLLVSLGYLKFIENVVVVSHTNNEQPDSEQQIVAALYGGAHFIFDIEEPDSLLSVRMNAALRSYGAKTLSTIIAPPYKFDVERRQVYLSNKTIALSPKEYQFAEYVFSRPGETIPKSELMLSIWSLPRKCDTRRVDTAACRVRKKMQLSAEVTGWELIYMRRTGFMLSPYAT